MFAGFIGVSIMFVSSKDHQQSDSEDIEEIKNQLGGLKKDNQTLQAILVADDLLISQTNPESALEQYQNIYEEASDHFQNTLLSRIKYTKQIIDSEKDDEIAKINLRSQVANQQEVIDSISKYTDSLRKYSLTENRLKSRQLDSLKGIIAQQNNELARKGSKQVISFTNDNGNLIHYIGEVKNDKANGGGIGVWNTGSIYKGEWKDNMRHGTGEFKWADGQVYEGEFKNDIRSGKGTYYWPSGEKYEGEFVNNRMNGEGILYDPDGNKKYEGEWKNDKPKQ